MIGSGGFASVHAAYWKNTRSKFAIKIFDESSTKEIIINEVQYLFAYNKLLLDKFSLCFF